MSGRKAKRPVTRALAYLRCSTEEQALNGNGLDAQRRTVTAEAERRGWQVEVVADEGLSGKYVNAGLRSCLDQLSAGRADALIVSKLDRLARSVLHSADILNLAREQGWDLVICDLGVDLSSPQGRAMANMLATFAEFERDMISVRTREGLAAAKARGKQIGRPRLASSAVVDRIVRSRDQGASFGAIARDLTAATVLSPQGRPTWQASTVRRIYNAATKEAVA
jgi:DNA invertase Pin-like site-specific DNA recombinase